MSVRRTLRSEAVRGADGRVVPLDGRSFADLTARASLSGADTGADRISGAAIAAVNADLIEPYLEARILLETLRESPSRSAMYRGDNGTLDAITSPYPSDESAYDGRYFLTANPNNSVNVRDNGTIVPFTLDVDELDGVGRLHPGSTDVNGSRIELPSALRFPAAPPVRVVANAEAATTPAWTAAGGGTWATLVDAAAPADPLDPTASRRVHTWTSAVVASSLSCPATTVPYAFTGGRPFLLAMPGILVTTGSVTLRAELVFGTVVLGVSAPFVVTPGYSRTTVPIVIDSGGFGAAISRAVFLRLVVVARTGTGVVRLRLPHVYAGNVDRGDLAGLSAVVAPYGGLRYILTAGAGNARSVNRVDLHGPVGRGAPTAANIIILGGSVNNGYAVAYAAGNGRLTARLPRAVTYSGDGSNSYEGGYLDVRIEEFDGGPGGDLWVQKIEPILEADVTPDLVRLGVDRTSDADPQNSTTPIGNSAATVFDLELDNSSRQWSPFRVEYLSVGHRVELAVGMVYMNRHNDPRAEGLDAAAWVGTLAPSVELGGLAPRAASCGYAVTAASSATAFVQAHGVAPFPAMETRVRVSGLAAATGDGTSLTARVVLNGALVGTTTTAPGPLARGSWWPFSVEYVVPAGAGPLTTGVGVRVAVNSGATTATADVRLADVAIEFLDEFGEPYPVIEAAPQGVGYVTGWPTSTDAPTVQLRAVDALGRWGAAPAAEVAAVERDVYLSDVTLGLARSVFDLGGDQVVVPPSADVMPWLLPTTSDAASYLADLAKAEARTVYTDTLGRLVSQARQYVETSVSASYREDNAATALASPLALDTIRNSVEVTGYTVRADADLMVLKQIARDAPPDLGAFAPDNADVVLAGHQSVSFIIGLPQGVDALADVAVSGIAGVGTPNVLSPPSPRENTFVELLEDSGGNLNLPPGTAATGIGYKVRAYATFVEVTIKAGAFGGWLSYLPIVGRAIRRTPTTVKRRHEASIRQYGIRPAEVEVPLVSSATFLPSVASEVLTSWALMDENGTKWVPDLEVAALLDPWREIGDRVLASEQDSGIGGEFRVVSHVLDVGMAGSSSLYLRRAPTGVVFLLLDVHTLDGDSVLGA